MKNFILTLTLILGFVTIGYCDDPPPFNPDQPQGIPIDGGAFFLLAAGASYGLKKINEKRGDVSESK